MLMLTWLLLTLVIIFLIGLYVYWHVVLTEGAYLGASWVALLYDWAAERYNDIKEFDSAAEDFCLGQPLAQLLSLQPQAVMLDVATGTGRIPLTLLRQANFQGQIIGLDRASRMLAVAQRGLANHPGRVLWVQADAMHLPFAQNSLPLVTCLEALEFLPNPAAGVAEMVRVLQPATRPHPHRGWLLTSQRIGWEAWLMPGKTWSHAQLLELLTRLSLRGVNIQVWENIYNLVWAQKV